jgi:Zn-dependent M16 (insulinase) family peptidase
MGHNYAASLATRSFTKGSRFEEIYSGVHQVKFMKVLVGLAESDLNTLISHLRNLLNLILKKNTLSMLVIGDQVALKESEKHITEFLDKLKGPSAPDDVGSPNLIGDILNTLDDNEQQEAWVTTTPVSYVARSYRTISYTHEDSANLYVLSNLMKSCFLHGEIREKGGAYGAMSSYNADEGIFSLLSYRDPNLGRTLSVYEKSFEWLKSGSFNDQDVEETILQTCSNMDTPASPAGKAVVEFTHERKGRTRNDREKFREGVLNTSKDDLIRVGEKYLNSEPSTAAVTSDAIVESNRKEYPDTQFKTYSI